MSEVLLVLFAVHAAKVVPVSPQDCKALDRSSSGGAVDCYAAIAAAISSCQERPDHETACSVELAPGNYTVRCPPQSNGAYIYPLGAPGAAAIDLSNSTNIIFGGAATGDVNGAAVRIEVDYLHGGCPAVAAARATNLVVANVELDTVRLPFTSVTV